jgi:tetratricopeptide (TPR) repeat protein
VRWLLALVHAGRGELPRGLECARQALELARATGQSEQERECLRVLGALSARTGDHAQAEELLREAIALCGEHHDLYRHGLALIELGRAYESLETTGGPGPVAQALECYTRAAEMFEQLGAAYDLQIACEARARAHDRQSQSVRVPRRRGMTFSCISQPLEVEGAMFRR